MVNPDEIGVMFRRYVRQDDIDYPLPERWQRWLNLLEIAPAIELLGPLSVNQRIPPEDTDDKTLLSIAACFADPRRREILRALILDLLADDLAEIMKQLQVRGNE